MKHLLLAIGCIACMTFASSCSPESITDTETSGDIVLPPTTTPTPPPPPPPPTDNGDKDKDKSHG